MLSSTAFGFPRFSMTSERRSSSTRRSSLPKLVRAWRAETTIEPFLSVLGLAINSPFQIYELYSLASGRVNRREGLRFQNIFLSYMLNAFAQIEVSFALMCIEPHFGLERNILCRRSIRKFDLYRSARDPDGPRAAL